MAIDTETARLALKRVLEVERNHMFGVKTGSQTSRRKEVENELDKLLKDATPVPPRKGR
jgi:hypothetical protein